VGCDERLDRAVICEVTVPAPRSFTEKTSLIVYDSYPQGSGSQ
jgi:hypothetical protein